MTVAFLASLLAVASAVGQSQAAKQVQLRIVNNGTTPVTFHVCTVLDKSYPWAPALPCPKPPMGDTSLSAGGARRFYTGNPIKVVMAVNSKVLTFLAFNPSVGKPYLKVDTDTVHMVEGELQVRHPSGIAIRFHREGDTAYKVMTIEILKN